MATDDEGTKGEITRWRSLDRPRPRRQPDSPSGRLEFRTGPSTHPPQLDSRKPGGRCVLLLNLDGMIDCITARMVCRVAVESCAQQVLANPLDAILVTMGFFHSPWPALPAPGFSRTWTVASPLAGQSWRWSRKDHWISTGGHSFRRKPAIFHSLLLLVDPEHASLPILVLADILGPHLEAGG